VRHECAPYTFWIFGLKWYYGETSSCFRLFASWCVALASGAWRSNWFPELSDFILFGPASDF